jgi:hypothetical protein
VHAAGGPAHPKICGARDRALDRLGNVVELQIQKDREANFSAELDRTRTGLDEEFEADLEHSHALAERMRIFSGALQGRRVEWKYDARVSHLEA